MLLELVNVVYCGDWPFYHAFSTHKLKNDYCITTTCVYIGIKPCSEKKNKVLLFLIELCMLGDAGEQTRALLHVCVCNMMCL